MQQRLSKLHREIRGSFPAKWDEDCDASCKLTLDQLSKRTRFQELERGVHDYLRREQFWSPAKLEEYVMAYRKQTELTKIDERCQNCEGTGWAKAEDGKHVKRCACWRKVSA